MSRSAAAFCILTALANGVPSTWAGETFKRTISNSSPVAPETCRLIVANETNCPVQVFINDEYVGTCESYATMHIRTKRTGKVMLTGRSLCDTWGPVRRTLKAGATTTWKITERGRERPRIRRR